MNYAQLSTKSQKFLEDLRVYLFSSGKNSDEIEEITEELEVHLREAEKHGKPIEKVVGTSPKEYMEMISAEMVIAYRTWFKYICLIILGSFSITIFPDLMEGSLSYSVLELVGHLIIAALFIAAVFTGFKYLAASHASFNKQVFLLGGIALLPIVLFVGLIYFNRVIDTPIIYFGQPGSLVIGIIATLVILGVSIWAQSWILVFIVALITLPDYFLSLTSLHQETQFIIQPLIVIVGFAVYLWLSHQAENNN
ncbi:HAAS domain-containing protein [Halobacillus sp. B23F22_1]|uniref:HAAS domain-containing protein n=1 Tax=Halobacillus sp. B23F22_1 TaxID=3459514 RepID=UPI00373E3E55